MRGSENNKKRTTKELASKNTREIRNKNNTSNTRTTRNIRETRNTNRSKETVSRYKTDKNFEKVGSNADKRRDYYKKTSKTTTRPSRNPNPSQNINRTNRPNANKIPKVHTFATEGSIDRIMSFVIYILVLFGILMIYSASNYQARILEGDPFLYAKKQTIAALLGIIVMNFFASNKFITYTDLKKFNLPLVAYMGTIVLLLLLPFIGIESGGQKRWIPIPFFGQFQPSEVMKHVIIIFFADYISKHREKMSDYRFYFKLIAILIIPTAITVRTDLSTGITMFVIGVGIIFIASPFFTSLLAIGVGGIIVATSGLLYYLKNSSGYHHKRYVAWLDPFSDSQVVGFQTVQSLLAIGSGGLFGLGIGRGRQKLFYIPEAHNDIIFAIICEELGFVGASFLILIFIVLFWRCIKVAINAKELFGSLIASGVAIMLATQTIINIAVATNSIPNTGIGLPFISYGGTSILFMLSMMGVVLNISRFKLIEK